MGVIGTGNIQAVLKTKLGRRRKQFFLSEQEGRPKLALKKTGKEFNPGRVNSLGGKKNVRHHRGKFLQKEKIKKGES